MVRDESKSIAQLLLTSHKLLVGLILLGVSKLYWQTKAREVDIWLFMLVVTYAIGLYGCSKGKPAPMRVHIITSSLLWVFWLIFNVASGFPFYTTAHLVMILIALVLFPVAAFFTHKFAAFHEEAATAAAAAASEENETTDNQTYTAV